MSFRQCVDVSCLSVECWSCHIDTLWCRRVSVIRQLATMKCERDNYMMQFGDKEMELDREAAENARAQREMQDNIEILITQLNDLTNSKRNMEVEIACYAKLLEGEENRWIFLCSMSIVLRTLCLAVCLVQSGGRVGLYVSAMMASMTSRV